MEGRPVWLASISKRNHNGNGDIIPASTWPARLLREGQRILQMALAGVGDEARERSFRMCTTLCVHRALSDDEIAALPADWHAMPARDMAGGPVEILYERGTASTPSTRPCENPGRQILGRGTNRQELYIPVDCGACAPCLDRERRAAGEECRGCATADRKSVV